MAQFLITEEPTRRLGGLPIVSGQPEASSLQVVYEMVAKILQKLNGRIFLGTGQNGFRSGDLDAQNYNCISPGTANVEFAVPHGLARTPIGFDVIFRDTAGVVYASRAGSWSDTIIFLKCSVATTTLKLRVY